MRSSRHVQVGSALLAVVACGLLEAEIFAQAVTVPYGSHFQGVWSSPLDLMISEDCCPDIHTVRYTAVPPTTPNETFMVFRDEIVHASLIPFGPKSWKRLDVDEV